MHNVTGFMVGKKTEREGLIKSGSIFVDAVSRSQVPHLSVICGASYGAGNYAVDPPEISLTVDVWEAI
jgi:acetyl-CoA carboxylase carboxyltransferase component